MTVSVESVAKTLISSFGAEESTTLERAIIGVLLHEGVDPIIAAELGSSYGPRVRSVLLQKPGAALPFDITDGLRPRLIGKSRRRAGDSSAEEAIRRRLGVKKALKAGIFELGHRAFEHICSRLMAASGATESFVTGAADEGGIDFFGRIAIRPAAEGIRPGLVTTTLLDRRMLFLGQSKCIQPTSTIQRPDIQQFAGQVQDCIKQYEGFEKKPNKRVPESYFRRGEAHFAIYVTTGRFSDDARAAADASDVSIVDGETMADFLIYVGAGVVDDLKPRVDLGMLRDWAYAGDDGAGGLS